MRNLRFIPLILMAAVIFPACSQKKEIKTLYIPPVIEVEEKIERLEKITKSGDPYVKARAHLELSSLYYQSNSIHCNYAKALEELEMYLVLEPGQADNEEIKDRLEALREIKIQKENNISLKKEIQKLQETINKLNSLDMKMEMKREKVKQQGP